MTADSNVLLIGQGVKSPWYVGNTCKDLVRLFGEKRVIDTPVSENAMTGVAVGAAIAGMKAVVVHPRADFAFYAFDPIINQAANWHYMNGGRSSAPVVFWLIINRGGEQAAQHSQAIQAMLAHVPGLKVIAPSTAYDVKGLLIAAVKDPGPVVFIDDRWLYSNQCDVVPEEMYEVEIGKAAIQHQGNDVTMVSYSWTAFECRRAVNELSRCGIGVELIDLRSLKPMDDELVYQSVLKTRRLIVVDGTWKSFGISAEILSRIIERFGTTTTIPMLRINLPDAPAPASSVLEKQYYITVEMIIERTKEFINKTHHGT